MLSYRFMAQKFMPLGCSEVVYHIYEFMTLYTCECFGPLVEIAVDSMNQ